MGLFRHYITEIDCKKLIKLQASQTAPYKRAVEITKNPSNKQVSTKPKVRKLGKKK